MKTLDTLAVALAAGWLLLNPPLGGAKAPLSQWTVYHPNSSKSTTFASKAACLAAMNALRHPPAPSKPDAGSARGVQPTTAFDHLVCVSADDPRLKNKSGFVHSPNYSAKSKHADVLFISIASDLMERETKLLGLDAETRNHVKLPPERSQVQPTVWSLLAKVGPSDLETLKRIQELDPIERPDNSKEP
jgi:hypothetical protein